MGVLMFLNRHKKILIIAFILVFTYLLVYGPHFNYNYPLHADEWNRISETKSLIEGEYIGGNARFIFGFHLFLAILSYLGFELVLMYKFLPGLFACLSSLALFYLMKRKINFYAGLLAMLFFASLPSNVNILGLWFFIPFTFCISLIYLFILFFTEGVEEDNLKKILYSFIIVFFILLIHPPSILFMVPIIIIYLSLNSNFIKKDWPRKLGLMGIPLIAVIIAFVLLWRGSFLNTLESFFRVIKFEAGYTTYEIGYLFPGLYGWLAIAFAFIGLYFASKKKNIKIFGIWVLVTLGFIWIFANFNFSLFASYQRMLYYAMLGFVPLSAIGLYNILIRGKHILKKHFNDITAVLFVVLTLILVIFASFYHYYYLPEDVSLYHIIEDNEYNALKFLSQFDKKTVMAPIPVAPAVYPVAGHIAMACGRWDCKDDDKRTKDNLRFYQKNVDCDNKGGLLIKYRIGFVLSETEIDCGWEKLYSEDNISIYGFD